MRRLSAALAASLLAAPALAQDWVVDREASSLAFEARVFGAAMPGAFPEFNADIRLDPDDLSGARIDARIMIGAVETNAQYRASLLSVEGLAPGEHPEARFVSEAITATDEGYAAAGELTIKGATRPFVLPFTLEINGDRAVADSEVVLQRGDFGVGGSGWGDVGEPVIVRLQIVADRAR